MEILKNPVFAFSCMVALTALALTHALSQSGFISIDCGIPENSVYTDKITGINYTSDANFTESGVRKSISSEFNRHALEKQFLTVRSFPDGIRNCYTVKLPHDNTKFLIRARFMYGNYDGQRKPPKFDLLLEADEWESVEFEDASTVVSKEVIHIPKKNYIYVCLANTGSGTPFISALELRGVQNSSYPITFGSLLLFRRWDIGSTTNETIRYQDDVYDRMWSPYNREDWKRISTSLAIDSSYSSKSPINVARTAVVPANGGNSLQFSWEPSDPSFQYYAYLYFAEIEKHQDNQTRELYIYMNERKWYGPLVPQYLYETIVRNNYPLLNEKKMAFSINRNENSALPPILNALEIHRVIEFPQMLTNQEDIDAVKNIKSKYGVKRNWQGDPCSPIAYLWQGLNCSYNDDDPPRIISLNLSSSGLLGEVSPYISGLTSIQTLDLSNNSLIGLVPDFLSQLPFLTVLNLTGNQLKGSVPPGLIERKKSGLLSLSVEGNPDLCFEALCRKKKKLMIPVVAVPVVAVVISCCALSTAMAVLWNLKTRKQLGKTNGSSIELKPQRFSYSDVLRITNNFERVLGEGGFGRVYHGYLNDTQVAVKMLSPSSVQGYKQFKAEVELLMRVHHKNLTTLVGYCDEHTNMGLIYEFMEKGNLEAHLLGDNADPLSWELRLRIATEAAQGLDYLHRGCKPPMVHRDVKSTNILLNEIFQAKLSDFGLSRIFSVDDRTHVTTIIAGTPGYLDPEYNKSNRLTEKSDVYSFGVVLLEIITSKSVIAKSIKRTHIREWVSFMLSTGDITKIVDRRLQGDFDINSVWKAVEIAMACVSPNSTERPTMNQVVIELNESLKLEIARKNSERNTESKDFSESISLILSTESAPQIR